MKNFLDKKKAWTRHAAYQVAGIYLLAAGLWELVAHRFLSGIHVEYGEWAFVLTSAALLAWLVQRNLGKYRRREQKLREITHWLSVAGGETIFPRLAQPLGRALAAAWVVLGELADGGKDSLRFLAAWA